MNQKWFLTASLILLTATSVFAHSTIYVDDIGRMHFLGKDPGSKANYTQQMGNFNNPKQKELTDVIYKNKENVEEKVDKTISNTENQIKNTEVKVNEHINKSKSSYTFNKGSMDASNPYSYGNTNLERGVNDTKTIYKDDIGRMHFFGKENIIRE